jgi:hypothetical protein
MKKPYQVLFKDKVIKGMYHYLIKEKDTYYMLCDLGEETIKKVLPQDKKEATSSFHYFNMLFCAAYDTYGLDYYNSFVEEYLEAKIVKRLSDEEVNSYIQQS